MEWALKTDNQGAIALSKDPVNRHIDIKYFIRDALHKKKIDYPLSNHR